MFKVGADPEFFLVDKEGNPVSAHEVLPGTKEEPFPLMNGAVQVDGTAVEFNIEPANTAREFVENMESVLLQIRGMVPECLDFLFYPVVTYPAPYFVELPMFVRQLGCDPDFNAYKLGKKNPRPDDRTTMRTGAGHLHIGWKDRVDNSREHVADCCDVVISLDRTLGVLERAWCDDRKRRELYGQRGAFRPKQYGVEYRVLSNSWLKYPRLWPWLFDMAEFVADRIVNQKQPLPEVALNPEYHTDRIHLPENWPQFPRNWKSMENTPWLSLS